MQYYKKRDADIFLKYFKYEITIEMLFNNISEHYFSNILVILHVEWDDFELHCIEKHSCAIVSLD